LDERSLDLISLAGGWWQLRGHFGSNSEEVGLKLAVKNPDHENNEFFQVGYDVGPLIQKAVNWLTRGKTRHLIKAVAGSKVSAKCGKEFKNSQDHFGTVWASDVNCPDCLATMGNDIKAMKELEKSIAKAASNYMPKKAPGVKKKTVADIMAAKAGLVEDDDIW
jgi:hypothetical protein